MALVIGATGHQALKERLRREGSRDSEDDAWRWTLTVFNRYLQNFQQPLVILSSLAAGADQKLSQAALDDSMAIDAVIPSDNLESSFQNEADRETFRQLLQQARHVTQLAHPEPSERAYYEAGVWTVDHSDRVVAVWDGKEAVGLGGTGDAVTYALSLGKDVFQIDPIHRVANRLTRGS